MQGPDQQHRALLTLTKMRRKARLRISSTSIFNKTNTKSQKTSDRKQSIETAGDRGWDKHAQKVKLHIHLNFYSSSNMHFQLNRIVNRAVGPITLTVLDSIK